MNFDLNDEQRLLRQTAGVTRREFIRLAVGGSGLLLLNACTSPAQPTTAPQAKPAITTAPTQITAQSTGELIVAQPAEFLYLDPHSAFYPTDVNMTYSIFDSLVRRGDDLKLIPSLATSWEPISPTEWTFELRQGVKFHNGEVFNAEVVKWNVERIVEPGFNRLPQLPRDMQAEVVDEYTVRISSPKAPDPTFPARMTLFFIVPPNYVETAGADAFNNLVGSGPYRFVERVKDSHITMEANPEWWGGAPKIKTVTWKVIPQSATRLAALKAGEVGVVSALTTDQFTEVNTDPNLRAIWVRSLRAPLVMFWPESPQGGGEPLKNVKVRQALNYAVNVDNIIKFLLEDMAWRMNAGLTPEFPFYDESVESYPYDPELAKKMLSEAGYADGFELNFDISSGTVIAIKAEEVTQAIADDLAAVGVKANINVHDIATAVKMRDEHKIAPMFLWSFGGPLVDPDDKFWAPLASDSPYSFMIDPDIDRLIHQGRTTVDESARAEIYHELQMRTKDYAPFIFLYAQPDIYGMIERLNWQPRSDERQFYWTASFAS